MTATAATSVLEYSLFGGGGERRGGRHCTLHDARRTLHAPVHRSDLRGVILPRYARTGCETIAGRFVVINSSRVRGPREDLFLIS